MPYDPNLLFSRPATDEPEDFNPADTISAQYDLSLLTRKGPSDPEKKQYDSSLLTRTPVVEEPTESTEPQIGEPGWGEMLATGKGRAKPEPKPDFPRGPQTLPPEAAPAAATPGAAPGIDVPAGLPGQPQFVAARDAGKAITQPGGIPDLHKVSEELTPSKKAVGGREVADMFTESDDLGTQMTGYFLKSMDFLADAAKFPTIDMAAFVTDIADATKKKVIDGDDEPLKQLTHDIVYDIEKLMILRESPIYRIIKWAAPDLPALKVVDWIDKNAPRLTIDDLDKAREEMAQARKTHAFWEYVGRPLVATGALKHGAAKARKAVATKEARKSSEQTFTMEDLIGEREKQGLEKIVGEERRAEKGRAAIEGRRPEEGIERKAPGRIRVRDAEKDGLEAVVREAETKAPKEVEVTKAAGIWEMDIKDAVTEPDRFQISREEAFSERTAASVEKAEKAKPGTVKEPVTVWKDPKSGDWHVLDGFSRMEGFERAGRERANFQEFKGTEKQAVDYAIKKNKQVSTPGFAGDLKSYKRASKEGWTQKKLRSTFGRDTRLLDASKHLDPAGKFIDVLSDPTLEKQAPYVREYAGWMGRLRKDYGNKLKHRHEQQIFDFIYETDKFERINKDRVEAIIADQAGAFDWKPTNKLILKRGEQAKVGAAAQANTAPIVRQIAELERQISDINVTLKKHTTPEKTRTANKLIGLHQERIGHLKAAIRDIGHRQTDIFSIMDEAGKKDSQALRVIDKMEQAAKDRLQKRAEQAGQKLYDIGGAAGESLLNVADLAVVGAAKMARGVVKFHQWARAMKKEFGKNIEPHLEEIYQKAMSRLLDLGKENREKPMHRKSEKMAVRVNQRAVKASKAISEFTREIEELNERIAINIGEKMSIEGAKQIMIRHHAATRAPDYGTRFMKEAVDQAVPKKARQKLVLHAYEQRRNPKYWDQLTEKERDVVRWFEAEIEILEDFVRRNKFYPDWQMELFTKEPYNYVFHWFKNPRTGSPYAAKFGKTTAHAPQEFKRIFATIEIAEAADQLVYFPKMKSLDPLHQLKIPNLVEYKHKPTLPEKIKGKVTAAEGKADKATGVKVWIKDIPEFNEAIKKLGGEVLETRPGMELASTNIGEIFGQTWQSRIRQFSSRRMYDALSKLQTGITNKVTVPGTKGETVTRNPMMIESWETITEHGLEREYRPAGEHRWEQAVKIERVGERGKKVWRAKIGVKKELYPFLEAYLKSPTYGNFAKMMFLSKAIKLGMSFFHHVSLGMQELAQGRIPFKNIPRGLRLIKGGDETMQILYRQGGEFLKGYEDINYGEMFKFKGESIAAKVGNAAFKPFELGAKFLFEVVQPGMKASFAWDEFHKGWAEAQKHGMTKDQWAREVVKMADSHFSGEDYKRAMLETNAWMARYYFSATARKAWQMTFISPTWQREHLLVFKRAAQSMPGAYKLSQKFGMEEMSPMMRRQYQRYVMRAAVMFAAANMYNWMTTKKEDGKGKFMWENPNIWSVRAPWNTPAYTYADSRGKERKVPSRPAYVRPFKSIIEVPEFILGHGIRKHEETGEYTARSVAGGIAENMIRKTTYKLLPMVGASAKTLIGRGYYDELDVSDVSKWVVDVASPIIGEQLYSSIIGQKDPRGVVTAFFGMPESSIRIRIFKDMYYERMAQAQLEKDRDEYIRLRAEYKEVFGTNVSTTKLRNMKEKLREAAGLAED